VILVKGGRTASGSKAALSHTASLVGNFAAWQAVARQAGVYLVETFEDVIDLAKHVTYHGKRRVKSACMLTLSGGYGVICSDTLTSYDIVLPDFAGNARLQESLRYVLGSVGTSIGNPVDVGAFIYDVSKLETIANAVLSEPTIDALIFEIAPLYVASSLRPDVHLETELPDMLERVKKASRKPVLVICEDIGFDAVRNDIVSRLRKVQIPVYADIMHVARVLRYTNGIRMKEG
jgi:acyl-CoA synthetase (NDP forming)